MTLAPLRVSEAADSLAKASTPEPFSTSKTSNWIAKLGGLPPYIQHIAHDLMEKRNKTESNAIQMAIGIVENPPKNWGADARAAAAKAHAQWLALRGKNAAKSALHASVFVSIADEFALREAALERLAVFEQQMGARGLVEFLDAGAVLQEAAMTWSPTLKRTASASNELERHEVHDGGQCVGMISRRASYARAEPDRWSAQAVNGDRVTDYSGGSREKALSALHKHLEEAPARVGKHTNGKFLVARPASYSGPDSFTAYPTQSAARFAAGLPEKPSTPEQNSQVQALGEMLRFDLLTVSGLDIPPLRRAQEARRRDPFGLAEDFNPAEARGFGGKWIPGGGHHASMSARNLPGRDTRLRGIKPDTQRRYEGGVTRMSPGTRRELLGAFTPAERDAPKQRQPTKNLDELYKLAEPHREQFTQILKTVASKLDATVHAKGSSAMGDALGGQGANKAHVLVNSIKGRERATVKVKGKYNGDASRLNDVVRGAIAVPHVDHLAGALRELRAALPKGWTITSPENRYVQGRRADHVNTGDLNGYRDISMNLRSPQGFNVELQITTTHMLQAKNMGHKLYEMRRLLVENGVKKQLTRDQAYRVKKLDEQARELYTQAMLRSSRLIPPPR